MQEGVHTTQIRCQWAGTLGSQKRLQTNGMGERMEEGTWIWGGAGSSPRLSFLMLPLWSPSVVGAWSVHPWNATSALWAAGLMDISPFIPTSLTTKTWPWFSSLSPVSYRHPFVVAMQPWFVTLPVERGAWGLPWAFSPAFGLGVTAHLPQCWPCCGFSVGDDAVSCSSDFSRVATLLKSEFQSQKFVFCQSTWDPWLNPGDWCKPSLLILVRNTISRSAQTQVVSTSHLSMKNRLWKPTMQTLLGLEQSELSKQSYCVIWDCDAYTRCPSPWVTSSIWTLGQDNFLLTHSPRQWWGHAN